MPRMKIDPIERFWSKVEKTDGCWWWRGTVMYRGYGMFWLGSHGNNVRAHRWIYEQLVGPIPPGLQLDHLCRNRLCVRPDHLEPVTCQENLLRGDTFNARNAAKTHCPSGHAYDEANTVHGTNGRACKECRRVRDRQRRARRKVAV